MRLIRNRRIVYGWLIMTGLMAILSLRLAWVQLVMKQQPIPRSVHTMVEASLIQRMRGIVLDSGRGHFTDRNGRPLTGKQIWTVVLFPMGEQELRNSHHQLVKLARILGVNQDQLLKSWGNLKGPTIWHGDNKRIPHALTKDEIKQIQELKLPNLKILPYEQRYEDRQSGMQWLGYVSGQRKENLFYHGKAELVGNSGLEKTMDSLIRGEGPTVVYFPIDSRNEVIHDIKAMVQAPDNPYYPLRIVTTIDIDIQKEIENVTEKAGMKKGAVVVLDTRNADIVAMVSRPFYNPEHIRPSEGQWESRGLNAVTPGSIFKLVTAAAVLENELSYPEEHFDCTGEYGKFGLSCWKKGGHGTISLREGFAESCNVVFATLAERLSAQQLSNAATALGFGQTVGWRTEQFLGISSFTPLDHEEKGSVFSSSVDTSDAGVRVQTSIGQRDVTISPLQAANAIVTLLHGGVKTKPRIVQQVRYANGQLLQDIEPLRELVAKNSISRETSSILLEWMKQVVQDGTGSSALKNRKWSLAGKSGTAQVQQKGRTRNNQWFVGYGPVGKPRYAAAVLVENRSPDSSHQAAEIFGQVFDFLASFESDSGSV